MRSSERAEVNTWGKSLPDRNNGRKLGSGNKPWSSARSLPLSPGHVPSQVLQGKSTVTDLDIPNFLPGQQVHSYGSLHVLWEKVLPDGRHHLIADASNKVRTLTLTLII